MTQIVCACVCVCVIVSTDNLAEMSSSAIGSNMTELISHIGSNKCNVWGRCKVKNM